MPTDLLLPAFALTLLATAILGAAAIRALRSRSDWDGDDRMAERGRPEASIPRSIARPPELDTPRPIRNEPPTASDGEEPQPTAPTEQPRPAEAQQHRRRATDAPAAADVSPAEPDPRPRGRRGGPSASGKPGPARPAPGKPASRRGPSAGDATTPSPGDRPRPVTPRPKPPAKGTAKPDDATGSRASTDTPRRSASRGGRRRFSLPPLDDDHDRVVRSIETFLLGGEAGEAAEARASSAAGLATVATTVAAIAIDGLAPNATRHDREAFDAAVATLERSLRGSARAADRLTATGRGRFRIILSATGELAARAYLRRVRATVEPSLSASNTPLSLVTATSTVLDEAAGVAIAQAEARLDAALDSAAGQEPDHRPRAAAD